jgi:hypothetical protein
MKFKIFFICLVLVYPTYSQVRVDHYAEIGTNMVSNGLYGNLSTSVVGNYKQFNLTGGALLSVINPQSGLINAMTVGVGGEFHVKNFKMKMDGFYLWKPISENLREYNGGIIASSRFHHFGVKLGVNTRVYGLSKAATMKYHLSDTVSTSIWEPVNLMYQFSFYQPLSTKCNLEVRITNYDKYMILQETNPMIMTRVDYAIAPKMWLYAELYYMEAGLLNMRVNYFGYNGRGGLIWEI